MNDVSNPDLIPTVTRRPKAVSVRTYHAALHEPGASRLTAEEIAIVTQALVILENKVVRKLKPGEILTNPERVKQWLTLHYGMLDREVFGLIFLDARHRYLGHQQLFNGDIQGASVHPRQVARSVFAYNAAAVVAVQADIPAKWPSRRMRMSSSPNASATNVKLHITLFMLRSP